MMMTPNKDRDEQKIAEELKAKKKLEADQTELQEEIETALVPEQALLIPIAVEEEAVEPVKAKKPHTPRSFGRDQQAPSEFVEKVIAINRITKVTKGGKKLAFSALVVVGDMKGRVGYSLEKASEVANAIKKAMLSAKRNMITVPMRGSTIPHEIIGECSSARVLLKPASEGTGVIAAGPVRAICDGAGIHNILSKCHRSNNPVNVVKATIDGLSRLKIAKHEK